MLFLDLRGATFISPPICRVTTPKFLRPTYLFYLSRATEQMKAYNPTDSGDSEHVAPLMQFFELVHVGDMIQSMVQVYFDKEVVRYLL